jgi:hypothetical protein
VRLDTINFFHHRIPAKQEINAGNSTELGRVLAKDRMAGFSKSLTEADVKSIQHYVLKKQSELHNQ